MAKRGLFLLVGAFLIATLLLAACGSGPDAVSPPQQPTEAVETTADDEHEEEAEHEEGDEHMDEDEHEDEGEHMDDGDEGEHMDEHSPDEHMDGGHDVPDEAAQVENPLEASDASISQGAQLYADNCAVCHGEEGEGDGPTAEALDPPPADLHEDHVQDQSDGSLFYIISHGQPDTGMPAWEDTLSEDERWHVVNFLRTFQE